MNFSTVRRTFVTFLIVFVADEVYDPSAMNFASFSSCSNNALCCILPVLKRTAGRTPFAGRDQGPRRYDAWPLLEAAGGERRQLLVKPCRTVGSHIQGCWKRDRAAERRCGKRHLQRPHVLCVPVILIA
jgi:hypothetical protein